MNLTVYSILQGLMFIHLLGVGAMDNVFILLIASISVLLILSGRLNVNKISIVTILFAFYMSAAIYINQIFPHNIAFLNSISLVTYFLLGININKFCKDEKNQIKVINFFVIALALHGIMNWLSRLLYQTEDISHYSELYQQMSHRNTYDFWNGQLIASTTTQQYLIPIICVLVIFLFIGLKNSKKELALFIVSCIAILDMGVRTASIILLVNLLVLFFCVLPKDRYISKKKVWLLIIFSTIFVVVLALNFNSLVGFFNNSTLFRRVNSSNSSISGFLDDNSRFDVYMYFIEQFSSYLFGGMPSYFGEGTSMHNQFFTIYQLGGLIPLVLYLALYLYTMFKLIKSSMIKRSPVIIYSLLFCISISMLFMVEGVYLSNNSFHCFIMFIWGVINKVVDIKDNKLDVSYLNQ